MAAVALGTWGLSHLGGSQPVELAVAWSTPDTLRIETRTVAERDVDQTVAALTAKGAAVGRNGSVHVLSDPRVKEQWGYQRLGGQQLLDAGATGQGITVAVIDTGIDADHPDLAGKLLPGYDIIKGADMPHAYDPMGHGTHVAGIIAADASNGIGVAGIAPGVRILPVRVLDDTGYGDDAGVGRGLVWAVDHGAQVVNMSLGTYDNNPVMEAAVKYAASKGVVVVASAGNDRAGGPKSYPGAYAESVAVAATSSTDGHAYYSTTGSYVDLAAPGDVILSTYPGGEYVALSGTSMAAPHVTAAVALVAARRGISPQAAVQRLESTAIDLGASGRDDEFGLGLISVTEASGVGDRVPPLANPIGAMPSLPGMPDLGSLPMPSAAMPSAPAMPPMPTLSAPGVSPGQPQAPTLLPSLPALPVPGQSTLPAPSGRPTTPAPPTSPAAPSDPSAQPLPLPSTGLNPAAPTLPAMPAVPGSRQSTRAALALSIQPTGSGWSVRVQASGPDAPRARIELWTAGTNPHRLASGRTDAHGRWKPTIRASAGTRVQARLGDATSNVATARR